MSIVYLATTETDQVKINTAIQQLSQGRSNAVGTLTLTANAGTTTITSAIVGSGSTISLMPTTANAAAAVATTYIGTVNNGSFVITHTNNAQVDKTFKYAVSG